MWAVRFLTGPQAGQVVQLKTGSNRLGRSQTVDVVLTAPGVSKEHLELVVSGDKILVNDLQSSNGTFVNGTRVKGALIRPGDKIGVHHILFEVVPAATRSMVPVANTQAPNSQLPTVSSSGFGQVSDHMHESHAQQAPQPVASTPLPQEKIQGVLKRAEDFVENVALPGVYQLPQVFEFRQVILIFIGIYILLVTLLSVVPMKMITQESIQNESFRRALTVARSLAAANERSVRNNDLSSFSVDHLIREEGISDVYILSKDGTIAAPPERTGSVPREAGFARQIRGVPKEFSEEIDGKIAAAVPILIFDSDLGQNSAKAHAVVIYNPGSLAFDDGRAFSLFVQMLFLAFIAGGILFFFLYKLIERPFHLLNNELDMALREGRDQAGVQFQLPVLQALMTNINSLLARAAANAPSSGPQGVGKGAREQEVSNILHLIGYPAIMVNADFTIARLNHAFEGLTGLTSERFAGTRVSEIPDQAMQQNFLNLMTLAQARMTEVHTDTLDLSGHQFSLNCQAIMSGIGDVEYYLIVVTPVESAEGGAT